MTTTRRSFASIPKQLQTLNINSRLVGVSFGALQTEQTTTSLSISKQAAKTLNIFDQATGEKYVPYVIEPSLGVERLFLALLTEAYDEEVLDEEKNDKRIVMHFHPAIAPFKAAVLPLSKKLNEQAGEVYAMLSKKIQH